MRDDYEFDDEPYLVIEKRQGSVGSFLLGAAVGAGVAILLAPRSGVETRQEIARSAQRARDRAADLANGVTDSVVDQFNQAREKVENRIDDARTAIEVKRQQVSRAMEAGRAAAQQARYELERRIAETKAAYQAGGDVAHEGGRGNGGPRVAPRYAGGRAGAGIAVDPAAGDSSDAPARSVPHPARTGGDPTEG
jgi:gas vesicle protein